MPFADKEKRKEYERQWRIKNKEKRQLQNKVWREANLEHIKEYRKELRCKQEKIVCECGSYFCKDRKKYHLETYKHKLFLIDNIKIISGMTVKKYEELARESGVWDLPYSFINNEFENNYLSLYENQSNMDISNHETHLNPELIAKYVAISRASEISNIQIA